MSEFDNLKRSYALAIQFVLASNVGYYNAKGSNEMLHKFYENMVENSLYSDMDKAAMKLQLDLLKETFSQEIKLCYNAC